MNATDQKEIIESAECPYCNRMMVDGGCKDCNWRPEYEVPPMENN